MNHYLLVGGGGTASYLMPGLHRYLLSEHNDDFLLAIVDGDGVETDNLQRQAHSADAVGMNKAEALHRAFPRNTKAIPAYLGEKNIDKLIQNGTTVLITVDNFPVRKRIEQHASKLDNVVVINAGNELNTGSVQLWDRRDGKDITPPIGFMHPEMTLDGPDRAKMTCAAIAKLPSGGQTAAANDQAASFILQALILARSQNYPWHEMHFDLSKGLYEPIDYRDTKAWKTFSQS